MQSFAESSDFRAQPAQRIPRFKLWPSLFFRVLARLWQVSFCSEHIFPCRGAKATDCVAERAARQESLFKVRHRSEPEQAGAATASAVVVRSLAELSFVLAAAAAAVAASACAERKLAGGGGSGSSTPCACNARTCAAGRGASNEQPRTCAGTTSHYSQAESAAQKFSAGCEQSRVILVI